MAKLAIHPAPAEYPGIAMGKTAVGAQACSSAAAECLGASSTVRNEHNGIRRLAIWLPSDVIDAIADAAVATQQCAAHDLPAQRLDAAHPCLLSASAQSTIRTLSQVCRGWRAALLHRAWRTIELAGTSSPSVHALHAFAGLCAKRLVVPWGAMAAPVSWLPDESANKHKGSSHTHGHEHGRSTDSYGRICTGKLTTASTTIPGSHRLRCIFGDQVWPNVEHLDMAFMPLICYHGLVAHIRWTMPRLRTLRIGGFIPATALTDILSSQLPLAALEVSGGVWANSDAARRGSTSSWRSSVSTVTVQGGIAADNGDLAYSDDVDDSTISAAVGCYSAQPAKSTYVDALQPAPPPLTLLVVTADALRSPPVFSFAMAHLDTLAALHLLDCDYKIMDMLRLGRLEERHMHAVEYGSTQMVLHSQHRVPPGGVVVAAAAAAATTNTATMEHRPTRTTAVCWSSLKKLRIDRYYMAPRENTCLCIYADNMPCLEEFTVEHMEPCDSHHPTPSPADTSQMPRMRGCFARLARIKAPALDTGSLRTTAPALRSLSITGTGRALAHMMLPTTHDIQSLLSSGLPLAHLSVGGKLIAPKTP